MCGGNRLVPIQEIKESEKLKIKSLLKLHSGAVTTPVKEYLTVFSECQDAIEIFEEATLIKSLLFEFVRFDEFQLPVLLCIAGYAAKKTSARLHCVGCKLMLVDEGGELLEVHIDKSILSYFNELNRGGLIYPS